MTWREILFAYLVLATPCGAALLLFMKCASTPEEMERPVAGRRREVVRS